MAVYRNINISFWTDTKVSDDFTPEDKYFMLYCLTNNYTNLCGCYEISIKQMSKDTGYDVETIDKLLKRFEEVHKIISYNKENKELLIKNWHKYNWTKSEKLDKPLLKEIKNIKTLKYQQFVADEYNKRDTVSIPYLYPSDTTVTVSDTDTVTVSVSDNLINIYSEEIGSLTPYQLEKLNSYLDDLSEEMIIEAIKISSAYNKKSLSYIEGILKNWIRKGYKVLADIEQENKKEIKQETEEERKERIIKYLKENCEEYEEEKEKPKKINKILKEEEIKIIL